MENPFANPFPGMNPYLESSRLWPEVHNKLIGEMHRFLRRTLPFRYTVIMEERIGIGNDPSRDPPARYAEPDLSIRGGRIHERGSTAYRTEGRVAARLPWTDEAVREWYVTIGERSREDHDPVAIVELLSPSNKRPGGHGRSQYLEKRERIIASGTHLVEIDLTRVGRPMPVSGYDGDEPYRHLISRWQVRPEVDLYPFWLQSPIPNVPVPLLEGDDDAVVPLGDLLNDMYQQDYYANYVDYNDDPEGPLSDDDRRWIDGLLRDNGLRPYANRTNTTDEDP